MNTRRAKLEDIESLAKLFNEYRVFYNNESNVEKATQFLFERLKNNESVVFVVENNTKELVGFVQLYPLFSSTRMKRLWLLNDLFVRHDFRGIGLSKKLIDQAKKLCIETDACELMLETQKVNHIGNILYNKTGFVLDVEHNFYTWSV